MKRAIFTTGSSAGFFPCSLDVVERNNGVELHLNGGVKGNRFFIPSHRLLEVANSFASLENTENAVSIFNTGMVVTKLYFKPAKKDGVLSCHLVRFLVSVLPAAWTTFSCERGKLVSLGKALKAYAESSQT